MKLLLLLSAPLAVVNGYLQGLRTAYPQMQIDWVDHHSKVDPLIGEAEILFTFGPMMTDSVFRHAGKLQWVQALGSGVDGIVDQPSLPAGVIVTSGRGVQATPVSEAALAFMFALSRDLPRLVHNQARREWGRWPAQVLSGRTVGMLGVGAIAQALAPKCKALGMKVVGLSSTPRQAAFFDDMRLRTGLPEAVSDLDYLILLAPLTEATRNLVDATVLACMMPGAFVINVGRGGVLDEEALIRALDAGLIAGAALDVFTQEPLPAEHRLWTHPRVLISPHVAGMNDRYVSDIMPTLVENLGRFLAGERRDLINVVRPSSDAPGHRPSPFPFVD